MSVTQDPDAAAAATSAGRAAERRGDLAAALARFEAAVAASPDSPAALVDLARVLLALRRDAEAEPHLLAARRLAPADPAPLLGLARIARARGETEAALALLSEAVSLAPRDVAPMLRRAELLEKLGRSNRAQRDYEAALARRPADRRLALLAGRLARRNGDLPAAIRHRRVAAGGGDDAQAAEELASALLAAGEVAEATEAAAAAPVAARIAVARAARAAGRIEAAETLLRRAEADAAQADRPLLLAVAKEWQALGRPNEAARLLETLLADRPGDADLWLRLARARRAAAGATDGAVIEAFLRAAEADPDAVAPLREACLGQLALGDAAGAEATLRRALARDRDGPETLRVAAAVATALGDHESAFAIVERVRALAPEADWAVVRAVELHAQLGRWREAFALLDELEARDGPTPLIAGQRARLLQQRGDPAALAVIAAARAAWPDNPHLWWQQLSLWWKSGALDAAAAALADPPEFARREPARLAGLRAAVAEAQWRIEEATGHYREALALDPDNAAALDGAARTLLMLNDPEAAMTHLADRARLSDPKLRLRGRAARALRSTLGARANEYLLEPALVAELRAAQGLAPARRLRRLAELVLSDPGHSAPAFALLLACRQEGLFRPPPAAPAASPEIPRRIAQFWDRPEPPPDVEELMASWNALNPGFSYRRFDRDSALAWLGEYHPPEVAQAFRAAGHPASQADIFRLALLAVEGGVYADADDRCVAPLEGLLRPGVRFVALHETGGAIANNFLAATPGHPVIVSALAEAVAAVRDGQRGNPLLETGPGLLSRALARHLASPEGVAEERLADLAILDRAEFAAVVSRGCAAAYKAAPQNWQLVGVIRTQGRLGRDTLALLGLGATAEGG